MTMQIQNIHDKINRKMSMGKMPFDIAVDLSLEIERLEEVNTQLLEAYKAAITLMYDNMKFTAINLLNDAIKAAEEKCGD